LDAVKLQNIQVSLEHGLSGRSHSPFSSERGHAMPYLTTLEFPDIDQQRYDELGATLASSGPPCGISFHACAAVPGGWRITDLWETPTAFDQFVDDTLLPAARALGWPEPSTRECVATYHAGMVRSAADRSTTEKNRA
jgi:hypothetical protein